jgi:acyl-CoA synthetase (AMP-forming)/AMP-acid ligase II
MREFCASRLAAYKIPAKVEIVDEAQYSERFKKMRRGSQPELESESCEGSK